MNSVLAQTFTNLECIIVDDGSTDNTRQVAQHLMNLDARVKYCYKNNGGLPSARNFGVEHATGEWIQCLDADDWIHEDKIRFQLSYLKAGQSEDIVFYCDYERVFIDESEKIVESQANIIGFLSREQLIQRLLIPDFLAESPHPALQQCMLMKKNIFNKCRFPEKLKALGDRYFAVDILMNSVTFVYTPMIGAFYTKHKNNRTNNWNYMKNYYIQFYESVNKNHKNLINFCHRGLDFLIDEAIRDQEISNFYKLLDIIPNPIYIYHQKIKINNRVLLRIAYWIRTLIPSFLLYEKYRGPRSKKLLDQFFKLTKISQTNI